jgi:hypothetical protein
MHGEILQYYLMAGSILTRSSQRMGWRDKQENNKDKLNHTGKSAPRMSSHLIKRSILGRHLLLFLPDRSTNQAKETYVPRF